MLIDQGVAYGSLTAKESGVRGPERLSVRGPAPALGGPVHGQYTAVYMGHVHGPYTAL